MNDVSCQLKIRDKQKMEMSGVSHAHIWDKRINVIYMCDVRIREGYGYCI
jgi:hypothetical protein